MKKLFKDNKGFTLVELVVVLAVLTILTAVIYTFFTSTSRVSLSVGEMNDFQNAVSDAIYRLRVDMADATEAESFTVSDPATFNPDTDILDTSYEYIVPGVDGGFVRYWFDSTGTRQSEQFSVLKNPACKVNATFDTSPTGKTLVTVSVISTEGDENKYLQDTIIWLRKSSCADAPVGNAIKYKVE